MTGGPSKDRSRSQREETGESALPQALDDLRPGQEFPPELYRITSLFLQRDAAKRFLIPTLSLEGHEAVLDIGCGEGAVSELIFQEVPNGRLVGIDKNPQAIAKATSDYGKGEDRITFSPGDFLEIETTISNGPTEDTFDVICSNFTLHWARRDTKELVTTLRGMRGVISPEGRMVHLFSNADPYPELFGTAHQVVGHERWKEYFDGGTFRHPELNSRTHVIDSLEDAGFDIQRDDSRQVWHKFPNEAMLASWMAIMPRPMVNKVPEPQRVDFGKDVVAEYQRKIAANKVEGYPACKGKEIAVRHNMILITAIPSPQ